MDIFKYINSKDIREYLKNIDYKFNTLEAMWLIYECKKLNFNEKCKAWEEMMINFPDVPFTRNWKKGIEIKSSFDTLKTYIKYKKESIEKFKEPKDNIYYSLTIRNYELSDYYDFDILFKTYDDVIDCIKKTPEAMFLYDFYGIKYSRQKYGVDEYCIKRKNLFGKSKYYCEIFLNKDLDVDDVFTVYDEDDENDEYVHYILYEFLDSMWFNFPLPFKKGDIVVDPLYKKPNGVNRGPFVLTETCADLYKDRKGTDSSDMIAYGIFVSEDGTAYSECMHNYMNLEYYKDKIEGPVRSLVPISNYLKGEIDITLCVLGYHQIQLEIQKENGMSCFDGIDNEGKKLAGLNMEDINGKK